MSARSAQLARRPGGRPRSPAAAAGGCRTQPGRAARRSPGGVCRAGPRSPLEEIALRAGVGIGTLYRRFPSRTQLVAAALVDKVTQYAEAAEQALAIPDPWAGFVTYVERICDLQADDRGLSDLLSMALPADEDIERLRRLANDRVAELIGRAKAAGALRQEFASEDLLLLLVAHAAVVHVTREDAPAAGRRFVALMLDAFGPRRALRRPWRPRGRRCGGP